MGKGTCTVTGCGKPHKARGYCDNHYNQWRKYGDAEARQRRERGSVPRELEAAARAETDECIILTGYKRRPNVQHEGTWMNASRAVWIIADGDPGDRYVLHSCNDGTGAHGCINRRHLYLGDHDQNMRDRNAAGHIAIGRTDMRGEDHPSAVLTEEAVREIRRRYVRYAKADHPGSALSLAVEFSVTRNHVYSVLAGGRSWTHVSEG